MGPRGIKRVPRPGNACVRRSRGDRRTGVIATPILTKGYPIPAGGPYPHARRIAALFAARLANHTPPSVVGDLIRDIVDGDSWQLRYFAELLRRA